jgi:16S rRNA processing protein RimM
MASPPREHRRVCVARIGAAHGVRGEVKLWSFTTDPMAVARYGMLESEDGRPFDVEIVRSAKDFLIARIKGVADRTAAEQLRNLDLYIGRDRLPEAGVDEYYYADLVGLSAEDVTGTLLGTVTAVHNFGAGDLLEVRPNGGGDTVMVPFTAEVVPVIDIAHSKVVIEPPAGIFDTNISSEADASSPSSDADASSARDGD